jgi:hypothetical protein
MMVSNVILAISIWGGVLLVAMIMDIISNKQAEEAWKEIEKILRRDDDSES